jgi:cytosine permease
VGGTLGEGFGLKTSIMIAVIGSSILTAYASVLGLIAQRTGENFAMLIVHPFGTIARRIPVTLFAILEAGWLAVALGITSRAFYLVTNVSEKLWIIIFTLIFTSTAFLGIKHMSRLSLFAVPLLTIIVIIAAVFSFKGAGGATDPFIFIPDNPIPWYIGLNLAVGSFILSTTTSPDIFRFARSSKDVIITAIAGFIGGSLIFLVCGSIAASAYGNWDVAQNLMTAGLAAPGVFMIILNTWTSYDTGLYTAALEMGVITKYPRIVWTIGLAIIACLAALIGIYYLIVEWLTLLSIIIPPIGGILMADYLILKRRRANEKINIVGIISWVIASIISILLNHLGILLGIGGVVTGFTVYIVFSLVLKPRISHEFTSAETNE